MKINIAHLYFDILNLYGTPANVSILKSNLEMQGIEVLVDELTIGDKPDFTKYDLVYIGTSTENNMLMCLEDLKKCKEGLSDYINNNGFVFCAGNSLNMFGKTINYKEKETKGLAIFDYNSLQTRNRVKTDVILKYKDLKQNIVGVLNQDLYIDSKDNYMFEILKVNVPFEKEIEGYRVNNFFGTHVHGPILVRNPMFLKSFIKEFLTDKGFKKELIFDLAAEEESYDYFMESFYKELKN